MAPRCLRLVYADTGNLISFDPNKSVLLLLKVANLSDNFEEDHLGKRTAASTPTLSSPQPQAGEMAGRLTKALLGALVDSPQETTLNFNTLPASLAAPIDVTQRAFNAAIPPLNFMTVPDFETLFNILVIFGLLYLFFTPPVGGDTTTHELFGLVDTSVIHDSELNGSNTVCCTYRNPATGATRLGRPRKIRSTSSVKQVTLVSSSGSLPRTPVKGSSTPRMSPQTASLENLDRPVQPTSFVEPPGRVNPKETLSDTQATEDMPQATRPNSRGIQWWWDLDPLYIERDTRCEFFPSNSAQIPPPSPPVIMTNTVSPSEVYNRSSNLKTTDAEDKASSGVDKRVRHEVSRIFCKNCQHICPPSLVEAIPRGNTELAQKVAVPQVQTAATIPNFDADPQAQPPTHETSTQIQGPAPLSISQQVFIRQPVVDILPPAVPAGPIDVDVPMMHAPVISVSVQPIAPTVLPIAPLRWLQQQVTIDSSSYFPTQSAVPSVTIAPQLHIAQQNCAHVFTDRQSGSDQYMDITDEDGDSWMRPSEFREATTLPEPAPQTLIQTFVTPIEGTQCTHGDGPVQQLAIVVACDPAPAVDPNRGLLDLGVPRLQKNARTYRLPYGPHSSVSPLAPSQNRKVVRLCRRVELRRRGSTFNSLSAQNKNLAGTSMSQRRSSLRKKAAARPPNPRCSEKPASPQVDGQPEAANLIAPVDLIGPVDVPSPQKRGRSYFDRLYVNYVSPFSQRGPSEVSLMACKGTPKSASPKKAFIWQCHFAARDRRAAGTDGRIGVAYQNNLTTGQRVVAGPQRQSAPLQRRAPVDDYVYPRRKRPTAADFIRAEDVEKEKKVLDATVDALESMGLNSENSVSASSSSASASDASETSLATSSSSVTQGLEFHRDQAQLLLEDIFEDCEKKPIGLAASFPPSFPFGSSSDPDSEFDDD